MNNRNIVHLFDKVMIIKTKEIGYVVDISKNDYLISEREKSNPSEERLICDVYINDVKVIKRRIRKCTGNCY